MSSKMARAVTKTTSARGTRPRSSVSTPTQKAMSVAMGMPHPGAPGPPALKARNRAAGTTIPPTAATAGSAACGKVRSSPWTSSPLISIPTTKKNSVIRPSITSWSSEKRATTPPIPTVTGVANTAR